VLHHRDAVSGDVDVEAVVVGMTMVKNRVEVVRRRVDVLVYLDVGMQPATVAWSAARLAPVQVHTPTSSPLLRVATFLDALFVCVFPVSAVGRWCCGGIR
jgi:hypothetical protein